MLLNLSGTRKINLYIIAKNRNTLSFGVRCARVCVRVCTCVRACVYMSVNLIHFIQEEDIAG